MSTNCLMTKLKGVVNNDNLPRLNKVRLIVNHDDAVGETFVFNSSWNSYPAIIEIIGDGYIVYDNINVGKKATITNTNTVMLSNPAVGQSYMVLLDKYKIHAYNEGQKPFSIVDASEFNYLTSLSSFLHNANIHPNDVESTYTPIEGNTLNTFINQSSTIKADLTKAINLTKLNGYYTIPQSTFNAIAPNLVEDFSMLKEQDYLPDAALVSCPIVQPITHKYIPFTWSTKTGTIPRLINVNLGASVDTCLKNLATLAQGENTVVLFG